MKLAENLELIRIRASVLAGMREFLLECDVEYAEEDIISCGLILEDHLASISVADSAEFAFQCVKATVIKLNELNDQVGGDLIETDQREEICKFIISAGALLGFNDQDDDVTEKWRTW
jgi:hypothetical protein